MEPDSAAPPISQPASDASAAEFGTVPDAGLDADWALRPWLLAALLGLAGLLIHLVTDQNQDSPAHMALAAFLGFGSVFAAFTLDSDRWKAPASAALAAGLVMAGLAWRAVDPGNHLADEELGFAAGVVATVLALPLFQAGFHRTRFKTPYRDTYFHIWNDAVSGAGSLAFVGISWALLALLSQLFLLLKIDLLRDLMDQDWFGWTFSGLAFGAALGTLRNQLKILGTFQSVLLLVLSLLAVPLAVALVCFLLAMIVSGPEVLWEATRSATPILLGCAFGAFVLTNAILRDNDGAMTGSRIMRIAGLVLALGIFPLTVFAAISMGTRVAQHGLSPERLWGLIAIAFACAYGLAYVVALVRGRRAGWHAHLRQANLHLAAAGCVLAIILALPIFDFGAISARNQIARLQSGAIEAAKFDYAALRWDFGEGGRDALRRLVREEQGEIASSAREALAQKSRPWQQRLQTDERRAEREANIRLQFDDPVLRKQVVDFALSDPWRCGQPCVFLDLGPGKPGMRKIAQLQDRRVVIFEIDLVKKYQPLDGANPEPAIAAPEEPVQITPKSRIEIRPYTGRQIYVDGKPASEPFE